MVFGGGDFNREKDAPPVFPRHTWASRVNANVVWWFDPSVYLGDAGVCWGYGQNKRWYLADVLELIALFIKAWRTDFKNTLFYGSSGGGFTAFALATLARSAVTAINPQCFCLDFWPGVVARFRRSCLKKGEKVIEDRLNLLRIMKNAGFVPPAVIFQCINAKRDLETQLFPFLRGLSNLNLPIKQMEIKFYENPKGHKGMPDKEDSIKDINTRLNNLPT